MPRRIPTLMSLALICAFAGALFAGTATARKRGGPGPGMEPTESQQAVRAIRHEIAALELFNALDLDASQQTALAEVIGDVVAEREAHQAARQAAAPQLEGILQDYLAELKKNGEPSDDTIAALKEFKEANRPDREAKKEQRKDIRGQLEAILSEDQRETLRSFRPMAAAGPSAEERAERRERREQRIREGAEERGVSPERAERFADKRGERRERGHAHKTVKGLLMSPEFLALLD